MACRHLLRDLSALRTYGRDDDWWDRFQRGEVKAWHRAAGLGGAIMTSLGLWALLAWAMGSFVFP